MTHALVVLVVVLTGLSALLAAVLLGSRVTATARRRHREEQRAALRRLLLTGLLGEPPESDAALQDLGARSGRAWDRVEEAAFALLPKIKGDAHRCLVRLLTDKGAADRAISWAGSRWMVRRARGAYRLGALGQPRVVPTLLTLLHDRHFLVRRGAVRALGSVGDPVAVRALLDVVATDDALSRDVASAIAHVGAPAAPALRQLLREVLVPGHRPPQPEQGRPPVRRAAVAAHALGVVGGAGDVELLVEALADRRHPRLATAAARSLGRLGCPDAVQPLLQALRTEDVTLRRAAAKALGDISDQAAAAGLGSSLLGARHQDARAIAAALLRLGPAGRGALEESSSPYAAEALAVHALRQLPTRTSGLGV